MSEKDDSLTVTTFIDTALGSSTPVKAAHTDGDRIYQPKPDWGKVCGPLIDGADAVPSTVSRSPFGPQGISILGESTYFQATSGKHTTLSIRVLAAGMDRIAAAGATPPVVKDLKLGGGRGRGGRHRGKGEIAAGYLVGAAGG